MQLHRTIILKRVLIFVITALFIAIFYPSKIRFRYDYEVGQPWRYEGVLLAPFDFKVYKSDADRAVERDSINRSKVWYLSRNSDVRIQERNHLTTDFSNNTFDEQVTSNHIAYLLSALDRVYAHGIISATDQDFFNVTPNVGSIYVVDDNNVAVEQDVTELYTSKIAYEAIISNAPEGLDKNALREMNIEQYLQPNLFVDQEKTEQVHEARLATLTDLIGEVQKGERIIGLGEVVTPEIFQELEGYRIAYEGEANSSLDRTLLYLGRFALILLGLSLLFFYLHAFRKDILRSLKSNIFLLGLITFFVVLSYILVPFEPATMYMIPFCILPILVRLFLDSRTAYVAHIVTILLSVMVMPSQVEFLFINLLTGSLVISNLTNLSQRSDLIRTSFVAYFTMLVGALTFTFAMEGSLESFDWALLFYLAVNFILLMFTYVLVYIFERTFGYVSNISLVELSDINKPLLRQLSEVAPGTFQHSLNVSILASEAVDKVGGNVRLVRSGALYHDIGKMKNPTYFTENQGVNNPHDALPYDESAKMIIRHVTDGIEMAMKEKLPEEVVDFIRTHHGLGMTKYFYIKYKNEHPDEVIDESLFHYPGPNPFTKEQGVLMLADAVEASSRSLKEVTEPLIVAHIDKIVDGIVNEGLLKDTPLTFRDIEVIKQVFNEKLKTMYHSRIEYPELQRSSSTA